MLVAVLQANTDPKVVEALAVAAAGHDVDGAADGAGTGFSSRSAQDLDALDLLGREFVERKAARCRLAINQDLGIATT